MTSFSSKFTGTVLIVFGPKIIIVCTPRGKSQEDQSSVQGTPRARPPTDHPRHGALERRRPRHPRSDGGLLLPRHDGGHHRRRTDLFCRRRSSQHIRRFPTLDWSLLGDGWPRRTVDGTLWSTALEHDARGCTRRNWGHSGAVAGRRCSLESLAGCSPQLQQDGKR